MQGKCCRYASQAGARERDVELSFGFSEEESDFIPSTMLRTGINYDIKWLGQGSAEESK
jgi:hypothetical protein